MAMWSVSSASTLCAVPGLGALSKAIILNQPAAVSRLVHDTPTLLYAEPAFGQASHFHLALATRHCLYELIEALVSNDISQHTNRTRGQEILRQILESTESFDGPTLADQIARRAYHTYSRTWALDKYQCDPRSRALKLLLENDCVMRTRYMDDSCQFCSEIYITGIGRRRESLKQLGLRHLDYLDTRRLGLDLDEVPLDRHAQTVVNLLRELKVHVPEHLITWSGDAIMETLHNETSGTQSRLIDEDCLEESERRNYKHPVYRPRFARALFEAGFRDVDVRASDDKTLLDRLLAPACRDWRYDIEYFETIGWLVRHSTKPPCSAVPTRPWRYNGVDTRLTSLHMLCRKLGTVTWYHMKGKVAYGCHESDFLELARALLPVRITACLTPAQQIRTRTHYPCSPTGFVEPFMLFAVEMVRDFEDDSSRLVCPLWSILRRLGDQSLFRYVSMAALSINYTCMR